jgi:hypothetical protein
MSGSKQRSLKSIVEAAIDGCRSRGMPVDHVEVIRIEKVVVFARKPGDAVETAIDNPWDQVLDDAQKQKRTP